jgi:hypothetical protein
VGAQTADRPGFTARGAGTTEPLGRFEITEDVTEDELHALLTSRPPR